MSRTLRIATFNLESLDDRPDGQPPLAARIAALRPALVRLQADILCLQEVNGQHPPGGGPRQLLALGRLLEETPYAGFHRISSHRVSGPDGAGDAAARGADAVHNLVILSRFQALAINEIRHELVEPPRYRPATAVPKAESAQPVEWDRPILHASLRLPDGRPVHVINLHLRAPLAAPVAGQKRDAATWKTTAGWAEGFFLATMKRAGQALETRLLVDRLIAAEPQALIAVCGDFNAEERQTPLRTIRGDTADTGNERLGDHALIPLDRAVPETRRYSVVHGGRKQMLDHVLVSQALFARYRHVEVHNEALADELTDGGPDSHHAPVVAVFDLPAG
jgi:endonuclease/exonuclease/phosphatase family metal-dependent hydrolase